jgi:glycosyltransferase involved in cell wall biosynthesis
MKVSVVLSYHKQPEILEKTLYVWTKQTFNHDEYEILVMDGGQDEEGIKIYRNYKKEFPNLRYFTYDGRVDYKCPIHSWNVGFKQAKGDILIVTMEDRLTTFDAVEALYQPHTKHKNIFCTVLPYLMEHTNGNLAINDIDWRSNPKLFWSVAKPTILATKVKEENETVMYSLPKETMLQLRGFDEKWRDYGYWMLDLRKRFIDYGLKPFEVSWIINMHHPHKRNGTMRADLYDGHARMQQWEEISKSPTNLNIDWGSKEGSREI